MDQIKIGKFIKECRHKKNLTQQELADMLCVSFKTVSKWECGKGLMDASLMIPLCNILNITVNELLNGEHINKDYYMDKAEEKLVEIYDERKKNQQKLIIEIILICTSLIGGITLLALSSFLSLKTHIKITLIILAFLLIFTNIFVCCYIDNDSGYFVCKNCNHYFKPTYKNYILAPHTLTKRRLKCPNCGKTG
ncbi:MAG: helix-turn-helix domain-containing protein, partial [Erysipelotrichaceae bacterium]|nr:helix-turn-helix domain-containing protein [Erysipelotrichaceae bacterium]